MPTEVANYIGELDQSRPQGSESVSEADDHQRLVKKCLTQTMLGDTDNSDLWDTALTVGPRYLNDLPNTYTPENWVTLDTAQTIDGAKTFTSIIQADLGLNNTNGDNLISEAADVTLISNYTDETTVLGDDADALSVSYNAGANTAVVLNSDNFMAKILDTIYPVGSVYHSASPTDPGTHLGGTWARVAEGRFVAGVGSHTDANGDAFNVIAGDVVEGTYNHTLTVAEMPAHTHQMGNERGTSRGSPDSPEGAVFQAPYDHNSSQAAGGGQAHNNVPPGYGLYVWERTA